MDLQASAGADTSILYQQATISVPQAARILGIGRNSGYEAAKRGQIPVINLGRLERVPSAAFRRLLGLD